MAKILLMEHDEIGKHYKELLELHLPEHKIIWCHGIQEAHEKIDKEFSVVVFDQRFDDTGELGTNFMKWCKNEYPHIVGIMLSAQASKSDLEEAFGENLIYKYVKKNKDELARLPQIVIAAISESEVRRIKQESNLKPILIGKIRSFRNIFKPIEVYKISDIIVDKEYVYEDSWERILVLHAGQKKSRKHTLQKTNKVCTQFEENTSLDSKINITKLNKLISNSSGVDVKINKSHITESDSSYIEEFLDSYEMPEIPQDKSTVYLSTVMLETCQIFEHHTLGLKLVCPLCRYEKYMTVESFVPTDRDKIKKTLIYSDNTKEVLDIDSTPHKSLVP